MKPSKEQIEIINEVIKDNDFYQNYEELKECTEDNECLFSIKDIEKAVEITLQKVTNEMSDMFMAESWKQGAAKSNCTDNP